MSDWDSIDFMPAYFGGTNVLRAKLPTLSFI
jgi:hypothetical protein